MHPQVRYIAAVEQICNECQLPLDMAADAEGLTQLTLQKVAGALSKLSSKMDKDEASHVLQARNTRTGDDGAEEDLSENGRIVKDRAYSIRLKLEALQDVVAAMVAQDESSLEFSPEFIHRALADASVVRLKLAWHASVVAVKRQVMAHLKGGNYSAAVALLDAGLKVEIGMTLFKDAPPHVRDNTLLTIVACIVQFYTSKWTADDGGQLVHVVDSLLLALKESPLAEALGHIKCAASPDNNEDDALLTSVVFLQGINNSACKKELVDIFTSGQGREMLANAKAFCVQRKVDAALDVEILVLEKEVKEEQVKLDGVASASCPRAVDSDLVIASFSVKTLGRTRLRLASLKSKASKGYLEKKHTAPGGNQQRP